jgi:hypothetical protein
MSGRDDHLLKSLRVFEQHLLDNQRASHQRQTKFRLILTTAALVLCLLVYYMIPSFSPSFDFLTALWILVLLIAWQWMSELDVFNRTMARWNESRDYIQRCNRSLSHLNMVIGSRVDSQKRPEYHLVLPVEPVQKSFDQYKQDLQHSE